MTVVGCGPVVLLLLAACEQAPLPPAPARLTSGIVIYQHARYGGLAAHVTASLAYLGRNGGPCVETEDTGDDPYFSVGSLTWSDCMSSVRVAPGWKAILFTGNNFKDEQVEMTSDVPDLREVPGGCGSGFNDCVSSIRVLRR
ncbi:MAG: hypothetical protein GEU82_01430 [Luteitalea sp.]|nr:hypothetical protein [Luteitalea sp.]